MAQADVLATLKKLEAAYPAYDLPETVIEDYVKTFEHTDADVLEEARLHLAQTSRYFPKLAEFREVVGELLARRADAERERIEADFWTAERRELWARIVEHALTCVDFDLDNYVSVEACLAHAPSHLSTCKREQGQLGKHGARLVRDARRAGK